MSVATKMEGKAIEMFEGTRGSEGHFGFVRALQSSVDFSSVRTKCTAQAIRMPEQIASAMTDGRIVRSRGVVVEEGMLSEKREPQCRKCGSDEVDDDDLGCSQEPEKLVGGHFFFAGTGLGFGVWAKTSRKSFSSRRASSRSAATASSSSPRFMSTR